MSCTARSTLEYNGIEKFYGDFIVIFSKDRLVGYRRKEVSVCPTNSGNESFMTLLSTVIQEIRKAPRECHF